MANWSDFEVHPVGTTDRIKELEAQLVKAIDYMITLTVIALDNLDGMDAETRAECEKDIEAARDLLALLGRVEELEADEEKLNGD